MPYGYHGRMAFVDLSAGETRIETRDDQFWRRYPGGGLLVAHALLTRVAAGTDAFDPGNVVVLAASTVSGNLYPGLARIVAGTKSPLTGGAGEARCDGPFARALKGAGVDAVVIEGVAAHPTLIVIDNGAVSLVPAGPCWGEPVGRAADRIAARWGADAHTALIGPAGERRVRFASVVFDRGYQAARHGIGAVFGSKRVKGVVVRGEAHPCIADPPRAAAIAASYAARMDANSLTRWQHEPPGFAAWVHLHGTDTALCTRNYRDGTFEHAPAYATAAFLSRYRGAGLCPGCPNDCIKFFAADDPTFDARQGGMHQEITGALGPNCGVSDPAFLFRANILCNEYGLDPTSLGFTLSMAMECVERGLLDPEAIGVALRFGAAEAAEQAIRMIAQRDGFGDVLAEGAARAARSIGGDAARYALTVKGLEMVPFEPRTQAGLALGYATSPVGPRYDYCEHDWDYDTEVGWLHSLDLSRTLGILDRVPMNDLSDAKVAMFKALATVWSAADAMAISNFAIAPTRVLSLREIADLVCAVTGWEFSSYEFMRLGEKRLHLLRLFNVREGLGAADDTLPDRFFDEGLSVPGRFAGAVLDRAAFGRAVQSYYAMMGWDADGRPHDAVLADHGVRIRREATGGATIA